MKSHRPDRIHIRDLRLRCIIGVHEWERHLQQEVRLDLTLDVDLEEAGRFDQLAATVDYKGLTKQVITLTESSSFFLVEALAAAIAELCLRGYPLVQRVRVRAEKPGALRFARSVGVDIQRERPEIWDAQPPS